MPVQPTYPGVYIEEIPSGVRTITGVATSITAFVGRTLRGPVNDPRWVFSFAEFERVFGGLWDKSPLSFAVQHYFQNGGSQALIVRVHNGAPTASVSLTLDGGAVGNLVLGAANPGAWGDKLQATVDFGSPALAAPHAPLSRLRHPPFGVLAPKGAPENRISPAVRVSHRQHRERVAVTRIRRRLLPGAGPRTAGARRFHGLAQKPLRRPRVRLGPGCVRARSAHPERRRL